MTTSLSLRLKDCIRDYIFVVDFPQKRNFSDGGRWESLIFHIKDDFFHGDHFLGATIQTPVDIAIGSFAYISLKLPIISRLV